MLNERGRQTQAAHGVGVSASTGTDADEAGTGRNTANPETTPEDRYGAGVEKAGVRHTPGPWLAASRASSVVGLPVVAQSGRSIASVTYFGLGDDFQMHNDECLANARLIAAAPDLLAAGNLCPDRADFGTASDYADAVDAWWRNEMLPALSKATGGSDE